MSERFRARPANYLGECGRGGVWGKPSPARDGVSHTPTLPHSHTVLLAPPA